MTPLRACMLLTTLLVLHAAPARAAPVFSLEPSPVLAGQPVFLRVVESDGCYEFDQHELARDGNRITVEIVVSDVVISPCPAMWTPPLSLALGPFANGSYIVDVQECGAPPFFPCTTRAELGLNVGALARTATVPTLAWPAMLLLAVAVAVGALRRR